MSPDTDNQRETSRELVLTVTANFTAEPIGDFLRFWLARLGIGPVRLEFSEYNQVFQELMLPNSRMASGKAGVNFLLVRLEDWARDQQDELRCEAVSRITREFLQALGAFAHGARRPTLLLLCPPSEHALQDSTLARALAAMEAEVRRVATSLRGVSVVTAENLEALYPVEVVDDPESDRQGHIPFTRAFWAAMGTMLVRAARPLIQPPFKVIVVDADNTLWGGVVGEVGADQVQLEGEWLALQEFLRNQKNSGRLLALASKNREEDVAAVFRRPEMLLRREDFVAWKVNWEPKSRNVAALAKELELGLDSFIFLDDNPVECADVGANCPAVTTLLFPSDPTEIPAFLRHVWAFDVAGATTVDERRTELYRQQSERNQFRNVAPTFREFIDGLQLQVALAHPSRSDYERAAQLTQRTNQFNTSGIRRTAAELSSLLSSGERLALLVRARDRFGDYGEIGLAVFFEGDGQLQVEGLLMSCRVLGKGVEHRVLAALGREAQRLMAGEVVIPFKRTNRNQPAERFLKSIGAHWSEHGGFRLSAAAAAAAVFDPELVADQEGSEEKIAASTGEQSRTAFLAIATELNSVERILSVVSRHFRRARPKLPNEVVQPRNAQEARLVAIWEDVLHIYPVGVTDSFLGLGGQSLQAAGIVSRIAADFGVRIPLSALLSNPTIAELDEHIRRGRQMDGVQSLPKAKEPSLSPAQQRLWFLDQFIPNRAAYNIPVARRIQGPLELDALEAALFRVMLRHDALRSSFVAGEGPVRLNFSESPKVFLRRVTVVSEAEALALANEEARRTFDLAECPLLRCLAISLGPNDHLLVFNVHHIVSDGWSMGLLLRDLGEAYEAKLVGREPLWAPLAAAYVDYAQWQREQLANGDFQSALDYWKGELRGAPSLLELPTDKPRPSVMAYAGGSVAGQVSLAARGAVEALAEREKCTPFMVLLAAWQTLIHRYSRQEDIVVGAPVAGRNHTSVEELVGCFVNTLSLRAMVNSDASFLEHLKLVRGKVLEGLEHQELPFEHLVSELGLERDLSRSPLFQVMLVLQNTPDTDFSPSGLKVTSVPLHNGGAKFDLVLEVTPVQGGYRLALEFDSGLFRIETAERIVRHFTRLLEQACASPETSLAALSMMDESEVRQMLSFVNPGDTKLKDLECLHRWFERCVAASPDAPALACEGRVLSYGQVNRRANRLAHHLIACGVGPDVLVGICIDRSLELVVAILGVLKAGGAYLPIDLSYPTDRLAFMLADAQAPVLLTETKLMPSLPAHRARTVCLDDAETILASNPATNPATAVTPDHMAYVIYTSGSTGRPKGCMVTHRNVARLMRATEQWFGFNERDVWTLFHSCAFDFSVWEIWGALLYGGRLVVVPYMVSRSPEAFYELLANEQVTVLNQTPSAFRQLIQAEESVGQRDLSLRYVIFGGEALEMQSLRPWFERHGDRRPQLVNMYGITETTVHVTYRPLAKDDLNSGSVIGEPIPDLQVYILDKHRHPVPIGVPGEMYVGGAGLARGYLNRPELTADRFIGDHLSGRPESRLYKTGDLARFLPGRDIEYLGRIDHQVKIRGFRIELGEIESVLCQHPAVRAALVLAREDAPGIKRLVGYVVTATATAVSELREHLRRKLPDYMVPSAFVFLERFPLTNNGKIDRQGLPEPEADRPELAQAYLAPRTELETMLAGIWSQVLRVERIGIHDNFFELGGDSILSIQIISLARQAGLTISPKLLFQHQTIAELATVAAASAFALPKAEQGLVAGTAPLTPIQHWFFEQELAEPHHYNQAFLFTVNEPLALKALARALAHLERHHDALRLRFAATTRPVEQTFTAPSASAPLEHVDLSAATGIELAGFIEAASLRAQATLDFTEGPLWRAVYFDCGSQRPARLLLTIHHLAVDGVSWRILAEDLERAYEQERAGQPAQLPSKTTSVKEWAERLSTMARSGEVPGVQHWHGIAAPANAALPVDLNEGENTEASARTVTVHLEAGETEALLNRAPATYNTQINDLLLAALSQTLHAWTGAESFDVSLEGHGREDLFSGVDLSRTVGWFTSIYPVRLRFVRGGTADMIKSVKEQLRSVPSRGIGYGLQRYLAADDRLVAGAEPQILFNYLGQFDQVIGSSKLFRFASEPIGPWHSPRARRRHLFEINSLVINGRLELSWTYSENRHRAQTIETLAHRFISQLRQLVEHCTTLGVRSATPSDFPLAVLDQQTLDALLARVPDLEDVYRLSPIQTLFYTAGANDSRVVLDHWHGTLTGPLEVENFQRAWELVAQRHPVLRTSFRSAGSKEPVQVVHRLTTLPWRCDDWRGINADEQARRWSKFLQADRARGMALDQAPLMRMAVIRLEEQRFKFLWTVPALLLDGWSWPLVFRDLSRVYEALCRRQPVVLEPARPYRDYLSWLHDQSDAEMEQYWRAALRGVTAPTPLLAEASETPALRGEQRAEWSLAVDGSVAERLVNLARQLQVTPNTLIQAAWAMVLARLSRRNDVVFGAAFAGRPADLHGSEGIVGPFVNNLPVRVNVDGELSVRSFLQGLHGGLLHLNPYQFASLAQIQSWTEVPWRHRLFDSIVVVQNYLVDEAARRLGNAVAIADFVGPIHTNFPLLVLIEPESAWRITLVYDPRELPATAIQRWGNDLVHTFTGLSENTEAKVGTLLGQLSPPVTAAHARRGWRVQSQNYVAPQTELERRIARVWEEMLQLDKISVEENVFDLGVHSLLAVRLHQRLCEVLGRDFSLVSMFQYPTIQSLAKLLSQKVGGDRSGEIRNRAQLQRGAVARSRPVGARR